MVVANRLVIVFRELTPKDFYFFNLISNDFPDITQLHLILLVIMRLGGMSEDDLALLPSKHVMLVGEWISKNLLEDKVMKVEQWLEMAFHLCKQRWDSSVEWLETQPVPKILLMTDILSKHVEKQNEEVKKAGRRRK